MIKELEVCFWVFFCGIHCCSPDILFPSLGLSPGFRIFFKLKLGWQFLMCCAFGCITHSHHEILLQFLRVTALIYWSHWIIQSSKCCHLSAAFSCTAQCSWAEQNPLASLLHYKTDQWCLSSPFLIFFFNRLFTYVKDFFFYLTEFCSPKNFEGSCHVVCLVFFNEVYRQPFPCSHALSPAKGRRKKRKPHQPPAESWDMTSFYKI